MHEQGELGVLLLVALEVFLLWGWYVIVALKETKSEDGVQMLNQLQLYRAVFNK